MAGRDRIAAVKRARERQTRIEAATVRVAKAQGALSRAEARRDRAVEAAQAGVVRAGLEVAREVDALVDRCGSIGYAADILEVSERQVRKMLADLRRNEAQEREETHPSAPGKASTAAAGKPGKDSAS
jgi:hypothetical protein